MLSKKHGKRHCEFRACYPHAIFQPKSCFYIFWQCLKRSQEYVLYHYAYLLLIYRSSCRSRLLLFEFHNHPCAIHSRGLRTICRTSAPNTPLPIGSIESPGNSRLEDLPINSCNLPEVAAILASLFVGHLPKIFKIIDDLIFILLFQPLGLCRLLLMFLPDFFPVLHPFAAVYPVQTSGVLHRVYFCFAVPIHYSVLLLIAFHLAYFFLMFSCCSPRICSSI